MDEPEPPKPVEITNIRTEPLRVFAFDGDVTLQPGERATFTHGVVGFCFEAMPDISAH